MLIVGARIMGAAGYKVDKVFNVSRHTVSKNLIHVFEMPKIIIRDITSQTKLQFE